MTQKIIAIVPAAGVGKRAIIPSVGTVPATSTGTPLPKQYQLLGGQPMLRHAVQALLADPRISQVRVAVAPGDSRVAAALQGLPRTVWCHCGGATRAGTVAAALEEASLHPDDWVLVHDAARPGLPADALKRLVNTCLQQECGGVLALPVADTVKYGEKHQSGQPVRVTKTVSREAMWLAQTPQMFKAGSLLGALCAAQARGIEVSDESSAIELSGEPVLLVPGSARNFKVTWPEDFRRMEHYLDFFSQGAQ